MTATLLACLVVAATPAVTELDLVLPSQRLAGGIPVRVAVPGQGRYGASAPVVVQVAGGWGPGRLNALGVPLAPLGFIELRFLFPDDARGPASVAALAEVIAFASGGAAGGRTLAELVAPLSPLSDGVGLLGLGNGGNSAVLALASHDAATRAVAWLTMWETRADDATASDLPAGLEGLRGLTYDPQLALAPGVTGGFYLEADGQRGLSLGDPVPRPRPAPLLAGTRRYAYPVELLREAAARRLLEPWPRHLLDAAEAATFWGERLASGHYLMAAFNHPELQVMVVGTASEPGPAGAHHLATVYHGWLATKVRWLRLNPDASYQAPTAAEPLETVANVPLSLGALAGQLPQADGPALLAAAACELADRTRAGDFAADLGRRLYPEAPASW